MIKEVEVGKYSYGTIAKIRGVSGAHLKSLIAKRGPMLGHKPKKVFTQHVENKAKLSPKSPKITDDMSAWDQQLYTSKAHLNTIARRLGLSPEELKASASPEALTFFRGGEARREAQRRLRMQKRAQVGIKKIEKVTKGRESMKTMAQQLAAKAPGQALPSPQAKRLGSSPQAKNDFNQLKAGNYRG